MIFRDFFQTCNKNLKTLTFSIFLTLCGLDAKATPSHDEIANCVWIYAPIHELAKEMGLIQLQSFTIGRIGWLGGYFQANIDNPQFKIAFETNLQDKKQKGLLMKKRMREAILSKDKKTYDEILSKAITCDKTLGIKTDFIPAIGM